jgi:hypothetical protein
VGNPEEKRTPERTRRRLYGYIKIDFQEFVWEEVDWIELAQGEDGWRILMKTVMKLRVPLNAGNFLTG